MASIFLVLSNGSNIKYLEKFYSKVTGESYVNPLRLLKQASRIENLIFLLLIIGGLNYFSNVIPKIFYYSFLVRKITYVVLMYLMACTPLPPGTSKIRSWINNFTEKFERFFSPEPCPIPIQKTDFL
ncbi:MAG: hypothetical protein PHZ26_02280 [Candidatus Gracilibacteria bacterium]|nr:hypothetical protein [Candidatus Gracilibacteria bacterium]MDD2908562.1 hypothetical protein [Candidatus Gracilibacteria bacterium]